MLRHAPIGPRTRNQTHKAPIDTESAGQMESESDDDQPGPQIPISLLGGRGGSGRAGPAIPLLRDLELKRGIKVEMALI